MKPTSATTNAPGADPAQSASTISALTAAANSLDAPVRLRRQVIQDRAQFNTRLHRNNATSLSNHETPPAKLLIAQAEHEAASYQWATAAKLYTQALQDIKAGEDPSKTAQLYEQLAHSHFRAAFQAKTREEFKETMKPSESSYKKASNLYEKENLEAISKRASARSLFANYWLQDSNAERRITIKQCITLAENALTLLEEQHDQDSLPETQVDLLHFYFESLQLSPDLGERKQQFERALIIGEKAIAGYERIGSAKDLVRAISATVVTAVWSAEWLLDPARYEELGKRLQSLSTKALELTQQLGTPYEVGLAKLAAASASIVTKEWCNSRILAKTGVSDAEKTEDSYLLGSLCSLGTTASFWCGWEEIEDLERTSNTLQSGISLAERGVSHLIIPLQNREIAVIYGWCAECFRFMSKIADDPEKRQGYLETAIETARKGIPYEQIGHLSDSSHALAKSLYVQATGEPNNEKRIELLQESLKIREMIVQYGLATFPEAWDMGVMYNYRALVKAELSKNEENPQTKKEFLQGAVNDMQRCLELCNRWAKEPSYMHSTSMYTRWYAGILEQLYRLTGNIQDAQETIRAYQKAITLLERSGFTSEIAPIRWDIAKIQDALGEYKTASLEFQRAAEDYQSAAKKIPASTSAFTELAAYMKAWSLIEKARISHSEEQYSVAAEEYAKSASALKQTRIWNALAEHYEGCSLLEEGESLSRQESEEKAVDSFSLAADHFEAGIRTLQAGLKQAKEEEAEELRNWLKLTETRMKYAKARADLEKARLLDVKGEKTTSLTNYRKASETFRELIPESQNEQSRREIETLVFFCDAWAKMKEAEAKASADLYTDAADLFEKAEKASEREKSDRLALANAAICRALAAGTRFRRGRDPQLYSAIKRELETAADYYQEGGFAKAASWTRATQRLFDALLYLSDAEAEKEARKKAELYHLAEQHLQLAAKIYGEAGFAGKRDEAQRHLERAREEKAILMTPLEVLAENPTVSAGAALPVSLLRDQALGAERYESANVVGNLSLRQKDVNVGGDLALEMEIANVGKTPAMLMKLENLAPDGFEIQHDKTPLHVENGFINMKGKRLEYLKTDEVKVALKALRKGAYKLRPRILFVDDKGSYRSYDFEPMEVTVSELGISGWLRGTGR